MKKDREGFVIDRNKNRLLNRIRTLKIVGAIHELPLLSQKNR